MTLLGLVFMVAVQASGSATVSELEHLEQQLAATYKAGDCDAWGAMLAPEWSVIHISGTIITKAEALRMCKEERPTFEELKADDIRVRLYGDTAVVTGRTTAKTTGANAVALAIRFTDVFVRREGRWLVVASQATRLGS
jgi:ketosteroid isomerase-like protein